MLNCNNVKMAKCGMSIPILACVHKLHIGVLTNARVFPFAEGDKLLMS